MSGIIEAKGDSVKNFNIGDEVFGTAGPKFGANAEYITVKASEVITFKPKKLSHSEAASSIDGFLTALPFLRDTGKIKKDDLVLIYGASGSVGSAAVQVAKLYGAKVTAVCSTSNQTWVKSIGADHVVDYTKEDFSQSDQAYDIIFDAVGKINFNKARSSLKEKGIFLEAGIGFGVIKHVLWTSLWTKKKAKIAATGLRPSKDRLKDLKWLKTLLTEGKIKPIIDKEFLLKDIVQAHVYVDKGHKKGNVVINIG